MIAMIEKSNGTSTNLSGQGASKQSVRRSDKRYLLYNTEADGICNQQFFPMLHLEHLPMLEYKLENVISYLFPTKSHEFIKHCA